MALTNHKRAITAGIAFALIAGQAGALFATSRQAFAEMPDIGGTLTVGTDTKYNGSHLTQWVAQDGQTPLFCADPVNHDHATAGGGGQVIDLKNLTTSDGHTYSEHDRHMIDYLVYYGTLGVKQGKTYYGVSGADLQAATQFAIWGVRQGDMHDDHIGRLIPYYYATTGTTTKASDAAQKFFNDAKAYADNPESDKNVPVGAAFAFVPSGGKQVMTYFGLKLGSLSITKSSGNTLYTDGNNCYSLEGAEYTVYRDAAMTDAVGTITTDAQGKGTLANLNSGEYYLKETKAPKGYTLSDELTKFSIAADTDTKQAVQDGAKYIIDPLSVQKVDKDTGLPKAGGSATLAGAEFQISYYAGQYTKDNLPEKPTRVWNVRTDENGLIDLENAKDATEKYLVKEGSDDFFVSPDGKVALPLGTITVRETKAPQGYLLADADGDGIDDEVVLFNINNESVENYHFLQADLHSTKQEQIVRGNAKWTKVIENSDGSGSKPLANVVFKVTSKTTGETHYVVTDKDGVIDTSKGTKETANKNDAAVSSDGTVDESKLDASSSVWFSGFSAEDMAKAPKATETESANTNAATTSSVAENNAAAAPTAGATTPATAATPAPSPAAAPAGAPTTPATTPATPTADAKADASKDAKKSEGMLPYDTYTVEEIRTSANEDVTDMAKFEMTVSENGVTVDKGTVVNKHKEHKKVYKTGDEGTNPELLVAGGVLIVAGIAGASYALLRKKND